MKRSDPKRETVLLLTFASKELGQGDGLVSEFKFDDISELILDKALSIENDGNQIALWKTEEFTSKYQRG